MKQHQELKAKIDGRSKTIQQCADLGKILIAAGNPASEEVGQQAAQLYCHTKNKRIFKSLRITSVRTCQNIIVFMTVACLLQQIQEKLDSLLTKQKDLTEKWDKYQEKLQRSE